MDPFQQPPATPPVSIDPPTPGPSGRGRGRMVAVSIASAGLLALGVVGIGALVSADRPSVSDPDTISGSEAAADVASDRTGDGATDGATDVATDVDVQSAIGPDDPPVTDLDPDVAACLGLDVEQIEAWLDGFPELEQWAQEWSEALADDWPEDWPEEFAMPFPDGRGDGPTVTVTGPDGVEFYTITGDGQITVTSQGGEISVAADGEVTRTDVDELFGTFDEESIAQLAEEFDTWIEDAGLGDLMNDLMNEIESGEFGAGAFGEYESGAIGAYDIGAIEECLRDLDR